MILTVSEAKRLFKEDRIECGHALFCYFIVADRGTTTWREISDWFDSLSKKQVASLEIV